jgi:hypothetical protein
MTDGFHAYRPVKRITMMRMLPQEKVPEDTETPPDTITVQASYWMAYAGGDALKASPENGDLRPIEAHIFAAGYRRWDDPDWRPTSTEGHLQQLGYMPYYKTTSLWAKALTEETWVQGQESSQPLLAAAGAWLCLGIDGKPWSETDAWFQTHYHLPKPKKPVSSEQSVIQD